MRSAVNPSQKFTRGRGWKGKRRGGQEKGSSGVVGKRVGGERTERNHLSKPGVGEDTGHRGGEHNVWLTSRTGRNEKAGSENRKKESNVFGLG